MGRRMRIDEILKREEPSFSVEFFPPKSEEGRAQLFETVEVLAKLEPAFFSVTYGAGGSTHDRQTTLEITRSIRDDHGVEAMAHLNCVGETAEGLRGVIASIAEAGIENVLALRGDPPKGQTDFEQPEGGLASAAELAQTITESHPSLAIGGACFPEVHPEAESPEADLAYLCGRHTAFVVPPFGGTAVRTWAASFRLKPVLRTLGSKAITFDRSLPSSCKAIRQSARE
jgi:methylenetetrahydrofolate reductase (NADPH)